MRNMSYINANKIIYRRGPITDVATYETKHYYFYEEGTHQCYELFRTKAKITTIRSLVWHLTVLWYLNPDMSIDRFKDLTNHICDIDNNFITFTINRQQVNNIIDRIYNTDLDRAPKNKIRKIIFKDNCVLDRIEKLKIVGSVIGKQKKITESDVYEAMIYFNDNNKQITIKKLAEYLGVTTRTIYRRMGSELNKEKNVLNKTLDEKIQCSELHKI